MVKIAASLFLFLFLALFPLLFSCDGDNGSDRRDNTEPPADDDDDNDDNNDNDDNDNNDNDNDDDDNNDNDDTTGATCFADADEDGYGNPAVFQTADPCPEGWVTDRTDCDDADILAHSGGAELPDDGSDQDCDGADLLLSDETGIFVAKSGNDADPGTRAAPVLTIATGIALADAADKAVFIAAGDYSESILTGVSLFGGYESLGWTRDLAAHPTSITGAGQIAIKISGSENTAIQGFIIHGGSGGLYSYGVYNQNTATLVDNQINGGSGSDDSMGVYNLGSATLVNNTIDGGNSAFASIGVNNYSGTARLSGNRIDAGAGGAVNEGVLNWSAALLIDNEICGGSGAADEGVSYGVHHFGTALKLSGNTIDGGLGGAERYGVLSYGPATLVKNYIERAAGGGYNYGAVNSATMTLANNVIAGGADSWYGGGMANWEGSVLLVNNTIIGESGGDYKYAVENYAAATLVDNAATADGAGVYAFVIVNQGTLALINNDLWGTAPDCLLYDGSDAWLTEISLVNACGWLGCAAAGGNISGDPLLADPLNGDYHLSEASPCRDTGLDPVPLYIDPGFVETDFEDDPRPFGLGWDIGADEYTLIARPVDLR